MLTLGFASSLFYYNEINKKNEIVMTEELYNPSVYKEPAKGKTGEKGCIFTALWR